MKPFPMQTEYRQGRAYLARVLVVYKRTRWRSLSPAQRRHLQRRDRATWDRLRCSDAAHHATLDHTVEVLRRRRISLMLLDRAALHPIRRASLVITVGGDGTFLRTAQCLQATPLWGVNSDPRESVGAFCASTRWTFEHQLDRLARGQGRVRPLARLAVAVNGCVLPPLVLNDVLLTHQNPGASSHYRLQYHHRREEQVSSGVWIATAAGSTGGIRSAGGSLLPRRSRRWQFVVREPYLWWRRNTLRLTHGLLGPAERLQITYLLPDGALYLDGPHRRYGVGLSDRVTIQLASQPLMAVGLDD